MMGFVFFVCGLCCVAFAHESQREAQPNKVDNTQQRKALDTPELFGKMLTKASGFAPQFYMLYIWDDNCALQTTSLALQGGSWTGTLPDGSSATLAYFTHLSWGNANNAIPSWAGCGGQWLPPSLIVQGSNPFSITLLAKNGTSVCFFGLAQSSCLKRAVVLSPNNDPSCYWNFCSGK